MSFNVGSIEANLTLDRSPFMDSLDLAEAAAREFEARNWEARLGGDSSGFTAEITNAQRIGESFDGQNYDAKLGADTAGLMAGAAQANAITDSISAMSADVRIDGETSGLIQAGAQAQAEAARVEALKATVTFDGDARDLIAQAAASTTAVNAVPDRKSTTFNGDAGSMVAAANLATTSAASVPNTKTTIFDGNSGALVAAAGAATAAAAAVPNKKTTTFDADTRNYSGVISNALGLLRSIPGRVQTAFSILNDPMLLLGRIRSAIQNIQNAPPTRIDMDTSQIRQATVALNGVERGMLRVGSAAASLRNAFGRDGSMYTKLASGLVSLSQGAARAAGGLLRMVGVTTTLGQATANTAVAMTATAASVAQTGQAATGAGATLASFGAAIAALAGYAALAAPAVLILVAAVIALGGAIGAILAVIMPVVGGLTLLVGAASAVAVGFGLIAAAGMKLASDFGTVQAATQRVKDAQIALNAARKSGDPKRVEEAERELAQALNAADVATKKVAGSSKEYATQLQRMGTELSGLKAKFSSAFEGAATELARISANTMELAQKHMPALGTAAQQSVLMMEDGFKAGVDSSTSLKDILSQIPPVMQNISETVANVGSAFASFLDVAMPLIIDFTQYVEDLSAKLATWADSQEGRAQIQAFLEAAVPIAKAFADGVAQVATKLGELSNNHAPAAEAAVTLFFDAVTLTIGAAGGLLTALEAIVAVLKTLIGLAKDAAAAIAAIPGGGPSSPTANTATNPSMAHGGDLETFAEGGDSGAHFVNGPRRMATGGTTALYGEALSGGNREYAFPLGSGWRFITEEPGFDLNSFALWADLGSRKGFFDSIAGGAAASSPNEADPQSAASSMPAMQGDSQRRAGDAQRIEHTVRQSNEATNRAAAATTAGERRIESAVRGMERTVNHTLERVAAETARIPERIKAAVDHNNTFDKNSRTSVLKGLTREASKGAFEGSLR